MENGSRTTGFNTHFCPMLLVMAVSLATLGWDVIYDLWQQHHQEWPRGPSLAALQ